MAFVCLDVGGTNTLVGVGNDDFDVVTTIPSEAFLTDIHGTIIRAVRESGHTVDDVDEVAAAVAGPIDRDRGTFEPPNIDREEVQIREPLERYGDVSLINDCNAAVLGEYRYGGHGADDLLYLTISSGIGAGVVIDGGLVEGWEGNVSEVGHMKLDVGGRRCGCGGTGCWEAYCSGNNLPGLVEDRTGLSFPDAKAVFAAHREGEQELEPVFEEVRRFNLAGLATLINLYNPEKIVVGGGVALNHLDVIFGEMEQELAAESVNSVPSIELAALGERSIIHGLRAVCTADS